MTKSKNSALWLARTGVLLALLIVLQALTKPAGQLVTGSCVNAVLAVAALAVGWSSGLSIALISPFAAFVLNIGPQYFPVVPLIALGNTAYVLLLSLLSRKQGYWRAGLGLLAASGGKFLTLYLLVVQVLCRLAPLKEAQIQTFSVMFSYPQLLTALIGGVIALLLFPLLQKITQRRNG